MSDERAARVRQAVQDYQERKGSAFFGKNPKPPEGRGSNTNSLDRIFSVKVRSF